MSMSNIVFLLLFTFSSTTLFSMENPQQYRFNLENTSISQIAKEIGQIGNLDIILEDPIGDVRIDFSYPDAMPFHDVVEKFVGVLRARNYVVTRTEKHLSVECSK